MIPQDETAKHCQARADECSRLAETATSSDIAEMYLKTAQRWLEIAARSEAAAVGDSCENLDQLGPRTRRDRRLRPG